MRVTAEGLLSVEEGKESPQRSYIFRRPVNVLPSVKDLEGCCFRSWSVHEKHF